MKTIRSICLLLFIVNTSYSQNWEIEFFKDDLNVLELETQFLNYYQDKDLESEGGNYKRYARMLYSMKMRMDENGYLMDPMPLEELQELNQKNEAKMARQSNLIEPWVFLGPSDSPANVRGGHGIGRMTTIALHPNHNGRVLAGAATGGIWISDNHGENWHEADLRFLPNLVIQHILFSPSNPSIVYAATEGGVIKSNNGGNTWNLVSSNSVIRYFDMIVHPQDPDNVIFSSFAGVEQSTDGGISWSILTSLKFQQMLFSANNPNRIFAVSYATDNGGFYYYDANTSQFIKTFTFQSSNSRSRIGVSEANPDLVYLWEENDGGIDKKLFKSVNEGNSFGFVSSIPVGSRGYNFRSLAVDPNNADNIFIGAVGMAKSIDGGQTWNSSRCDTNIQDVNCVHADHWDAQFVKQTSELYLATDGGIWSTKDFGNHWTARNNGLEVTQFYRISSSNSNPYLIIGGSQDNGTMKYDRGWSFIGPGDGMDNAVDPTDPNRIYLSMQYGDIFYTDDGGLTINVSIYPYVTGLRGSWVTPLALDQQNPNILYAGYDRVWKSTDKGENWFDTSGMSLCSSGNGCITALEISKSNPNVVYAYAQGYISKSDDAGMTWTQQNTSRVSCNWLEIDPANENRLWKVSTGSIMQSNDGGVNWTDIKGDLPGGVTYTTIVYDENTNDHLYVGTKNGGIYFKDSSMTNWIPYNIDLPKVQISELEINEKYKLLRAATYGRGLWETKTMDYSYCDNNMFLSDIIEDGVHEAKNTVSSDGTAIEDSDIMFKANTAIDLLPKFEVNSTARFEAMIEECENIVPPIIPEGYVCDDATILTGNDNIYSEGAIYGNGSSILNRHSVWYSFTAPSDGEVFVNSCSFDTRLKIWKGSCQTNDQDMEFAMISGKETTCPQLEGSIVDNFVIAEGEHILLEWDNRYSSLPFEFSFEFVSMQDLPSIVIDSPDGSVAYDPNNFIPIEWTPLNFTSNVIVELYNEFVLIGVMAVSTPNEGQVNLNFPASLPYDTDYRIKVSSIENPSVFDYSEMFTISNNILQCPQDVVINNSAKANTNQEAGSTISSNQPISNLSSINYHAGKEVLLTDGFLATSGGFFRSHIEACTNTFQSLEDENKITSSKE